MSLLRKDFLFGLLVIFPLAAILWIIDFSLRLLTGPVSQLFGIDLSGWGGVIISVLIIWFIGKSVRIIINRSIFSKIEALIVRVPIINILYQSLRQIASVVINKKQRFLATVYIEYPSKGIWSLGFLTNDQIEDMKTRSGTTLIPNPVAVFIPSTPNPTNGIFVFVDESQVYFSNMSVEDGIKCLMSAGMITPKGKL
ncbi:MAG: DUF502 domain-containing protein [Candidatus Margulisiibacteriota bacterium]